MYWRRTHRAVNLGRELENLAVPPRATAFWEYVRGTVRCVVLGTFFRKLSIPLSVEGLPREPGHRAENREWETAKFFEISNTE
jgi:hypothetical protein